MSKDFIIQLDTKKAALRIAVTRKNKNLEFLLQSSNLIKCRLNLMFNFSASYSAARYLRPTLLKLPAHQFSRNACDQCVRSVCDDACEISVSYAGRPANDGLRNMTLVENAVRADAIRMTAHFLTVSSQIACFEPNETSHLVIRWTASADGTDWSVEYSAGELILGHF